MTNPPKPQGLGDFLFVVNRRKNEDPTTIYLFNPNLLKATPWRCSTHQSEYCNKNERIWKRKDNKMIIEINY